MYVGPSALRFHSLPGALLTNFLHTWYNTGRSVLGLQMGIFRQICTELWTLIDVRNWFLLSIFGISLLIFFKLGIIVIKECPGIADG